MRDETDATKYTLPCFAENRQFRVFPREWWNAERSGRRVPRRLI